MPSQGPPFGVVSTSIAATQGPPFGVVGASPLTTQGPPFGVSEVFKQLGIRGEQVADGTLQSRNIKPRSLNSGEFGLATISSEVLALNAVTASKITPGSVTASKIDYSAVGSTQIANGAVTEEKIATQAVTTAKLGLESVATANMQDEAITPSKLDREYQIALGTLSKDAQSFADITAFTATTPVEVNDEDAASFPNNVSTGLRVSFEVPAHIDTTKEAKILLRISPSSAFAGDFSLQSDYRKNGGALEGTFDVNVTPSGTANEQTLVELKTFAAGQLDPGDGLVVLIKRFGSGGFDTHTGDMRLFRVILQYGVSP